MCLIGETDSPPTTSGLVVIYNISQAQVLKVENLTLELRNIIKLSYCKARDFQFKI